MLQYGTVEPGTLELLKDLMSLTELEHFNLVGGTALALYYGHRLSVDLDLFSTTDFQAETLLPALEKAFPDFNYSRPSTVGIFGFIRNVKVDFVRFHHHPTIEATAVYDGIRISGKKDIAAMKIAAILKRAVKKDFWDIAELLEHFSIETLIDCYKQKYPSQQLLISIPQALTYFDEAEGSEDPVSLKGQTWASIKKTIQNKVRHYLK
ncbi:MAG: nucleotidyl transferase AbiEii/AbiGii toxin family protein [Taibaiella sp.]|nr:nucleotidyl transferase AbiEii/AbiGii toxin family protein [Taibaiella sp.]